MITVNGTYTSITMPPSIKFELSNKTFDPSIEHLKYAMFLNISLMDDNYKVLLLSSVGDNLDKHGVQNLKKADLCIVVKCAEPDQDMIKLLSNSSSWSVMISNPLGDLYHLTIRKKDKYIESREFYEAPKP